MESIREKTHTYLDELSPLMLLSPSLTLLPCLTRCLAVNGATSSLLCTLNEVSCFFLKPNRFLVPIEMFIGAFYEIYTARWTMEELVCC